jgi:hypothetical protein
MVDFPLTTTIPPHSVNMEEVELHDPSDHETKDIILSMPSESRPSLKKQNSSLEIPRIYEETKQREQIKIKKSKKKSKKGKKDEQKERLLIVSIDAPDDLNLTFSLG